MYKNTCTYSNLLKISQDKTSFVGIDNIMLAVNDNEINEKKKISIRYDKLAKTYYCFYHKTDYFSSELILIYDVNQNQWIIDTIEYKNIFEDKLNNLFKEKTIPFEEQLPYVINYLDTYFAEQAQKKKMKINVINHRIYSFSWFRRLRGARRWTSQDIIAEQSPVLQRYSAPEKSTSIDKNDQIISVKTLAESYYDDNINRNRTKTFASSLEYPNELVQPQIGNKAPAISEIWLSVMTQEINDFRKKIGSRTGEEKLKKLAEKFVTYFSGTFQCNVGHQYQLEYDCQTWYFIILKVELLTTKPSETTKLPKTKIIFLIDGIPHYVRG